MVSLFLISFRFEKLIPAGLSVYSFKRLERVILSVSLLPLVLYAVADGDSIDYANISMKMNVKLSGTNSVLGQGLARSLHQASHDGLRC